MKLEENCSSDRSWLYKTPADFSDGSTGGEELLAVRFPSVESMYLLFFPRYCQGT